MARKPHHLPLSGGDRKALTKELSKSRAMTHIFAERLAEKRREGEALIREADNLACQSWNERMSFASSPSTSMLCRYHVIAGAEWSHQRLPSRDVRCKQIIRLRPNRRSALPVLMVRRPEH